MPDDVNVNHSGDGGDEGGSVVYSLSLDDGATEWSHELEEYGDVFATDDYKSPVQSLPATRCTTRRGYGKVRKKRETKSSSATSKPGNSSPDTTYPARRNPATGASRPSFPWTRAYRLPPTDRWSRSVPSPRIRTMTAKEGETAAMGVMVRKGPMVRLETVRGNDSGGSNGRNGESHRGCRHQRGLLPLGEVARDEHTKTGAGGRDFCIGVQTSDDRLSL
ncbi:hypothetical protein [Haladaptatus salinisoli]|uniref:hypothetical protein n=1 Tax=Haladaptatus salinisoli TaxID=2884876 RepID=UPI001D0AEF28|nr:hypothetical protein [Haladaptatus salinisoli]